MRIERNANGPRVYVFGLRIHHGLAGVALIAVGLAHSERSLIALGCALVLDDAHDFPWALLERT
jgi:hypothetical protein